MLRHAGKVDLLRGRSVRSMGNRGLVGGTAEPSCEYLFIGALIVKYRAVLPTKHPAHVSDRAGIAKSSRPARKEDTCASQTLRQPADAVSERQDVWDAQLPQQLSFVQ